jgi:hypothetical protein
MAEKQVKQKVYVVSSSESGWDNILGVFSAKEKALEFSAADINPKSVKKLKDTNKLEEFLKQEYGYYIAEEEIDPAW